MPCSTLPTPTHSLVVSAFVEVDVMNTNGAITVMPGDGTATGVAQPSRCVWQIPIAQWTAGGSCRRLAPSRSESRRDNACK